MAKVSRTNSKNTKSSSRLTRISASLKSHKKTTAAVSVIMIALIGGLYVRFSSAATGYTWTGRSIGIIGGVGVYTTKTDGRVAVQSIFFPYKDWATYTGHALNVNVQSSVANNDTYCFSGKATKELTYYYIRYGYYKPGEAYKIGGTSLLGGSLINKPNVPAGDFLLCGKVPGRPANAYPGWSRDVSFYANSKDVFAVYQAGRAGY